MNNLPDGADLLAIARETLLAEMRPHLRDDARYTRRDDRERDGDRGARRSKRAKRRRSPRSRVSTGCTASAPRELHGEALEAGARRARAPARGRHPRRALRCDDERRRALLDHLRESVEAKLRISNPKALET